MLIVYTYLQYVKQHNTYLFFFKWLQLVIQKLRLYCDPMQSERETACEIYSVVGDIYSD